LNDKSLGASTYEYLGGLYRDMEDKKLAKDYFSRTYDLFKSTGNEKLASSVLQELKMLR